MRISQYAYFMLRSRTITAAALTAQLLLEPDEIMVLGSRDPRRVIPRDHGWIIRAGLDNYRLDDQVAALVARLGPCADAIGQLVADSDVEAELRVARTFDDPDGEVDEDSPPEMLALGLEKVTGQHQLLGWHLDASVIEFLATTRAVLDVDEYG